MRKKLEVIVNEKCTTCPYMEYDPYYDGPSDSGYDCNHPDAPQGRIADDGKLETYSHLMNDFYRSQSTLFPQLNEPKHPLSIPCWCPLPDAE